MLDGPSTRDGASAAARRRSFLEEGMVRSSELQHRVVVGRHNRSERKSEVVQTTNACDQRLREVFLGGFARSLCKFSGVFLVVLHSATPFGRDRSTARSNAKFQDGTEENWQHDGKIESRSKLLVSKSSP